MRIGFIGDVVGKPARKMIKEHLQKIRDEYNIDFVIANTENASHGFGLNANNAMELFNSGIDLMTGGNHTWDKKKDIIPLFDTMNILRPDNYPKGVVGTGIFKTEINGEKLAILNLMGIYCMPMTENCFRWADRVIDELLEDGYKNIFIDFHAEATSEKRAMFILLKDRISALVGTHTHIGTDDLTIENGCFYATDIGLTGCRDNIIGMDSKIPLEKFLTGIGGKYDVVDKCKKILQMVIIDIEDGICQDGFKIKVLDNNKPYISLKAINEDLN